MRWIDTHVHLFSSQEASPAARLPDGRVHDATTYLDCYPGNPPSGVVVVHFSQAPDNGHVFASMEELSRLNIPVRGVLKATPDMAATQQEPGIAGLRWYALQGVPDLNEHKGEWQEVFARMRHLGQHLTVFGLPANLRRLIDQLPSDLPLLIDHLGLPFVGESLQRTEWQLLVRDMASRAKTSGPVFVKGPGYRTALSAEAAYPALAEWIEHLGIEAILLGASDAPFAGKASEAMPGARGRAYQELMDHQSVMEFTQALADRAAADSGQPAEWARNALLHRNAASLYGF